MRAPGHTAAGLRDGVGASSINWWIFYTGRNLENFNLKIHVILVGAALQ